MFNVRFIMYFTHFPIFLALIWLLVLSVIMICTIKLMQYNNLCFQCLFPRGFCMRTSRKSGIYPEYEGTSSSNGTEPTQRYFAITDLPQTIIPRYCTCIRFFLTRTSFG